MTTNIFIPDTSAVRRASAWKPYISDLNTIYLHHFDLPVGASEDILDATGKLFTLSAPKMPTQISAAAKFGGGSFINTRNAAGQFNELTHTPPAESVIPAPTNNSFCFDIFISIPLAGLPANYTDNAFGLGYFAGAVNTYAFLTTSAADNFIHFGLSDGVTTLDVISTTALSALIAGQWYHVRGTYDGETARLFIDGALENSIAGELEFNEEIVTILFEATNVNDEPLLLDEARLVFDTAVSIASFNPIIAPFTL